MASGCSYHSPQFSEDIAWLPAWLQPYRALGFDEHADDGQAACENLATLHGRFSDEQADQYFAKDDAKYNSCHLYLSGEDNSPSGNTSSSGTALHFQLHLSSLGATQLSSGQLNGTSQARKCGTTGDSCRNLLKPPTVLSDKNCHHALDNVVPSLDSPLSANPRMPPIITSPAHMNNDQNNLQIFQGELNSNLGSVYVDAKVMQEENCKPQGSFVESIPETLVVQKETGCQYKMDNGAAVSNMPPIDCKPRILHLPIADPVRKPDQNGWYRYQGKLDARNLRTADINDAIELSIAASEAMVISEMASSSYSSEQLPAAAILEVALRVKQARKEYKSDNFETSSVFPSHELYESAYLCDLDDDIMADAFYDVGLSVSDFVGTSKDSSSGRKSSQKHRSLPTDSSSDLNTCSLESHSECNGGAEKKLIDTKKVDANLTISQMCEIPGKSPLKNLGSACHHPQQTRFTGLPSMKTIASCSGNQSIVQVQKLIVNEKHLIKVQKSSEKVQRIVKENTCTPERNKCFQKSVNAFFNWETSFISESMDVTEVCKSEPRLGAEPEIVASSSAPFKGIYTCTSNCTDGSTYEGTMLSQDIVKSSILSLVDPLCSVVPCSISFDETPKKETEMHDGPFIGSTVAVDLQISNGETMMPNAQEALPTELLDNGVVCIHSQGHLEDSGALHHGHFNSIKPYTMVMSCHHTTEETVNHTEPLTLHNKDERTIYLCPEKSSSFSEPKKDWSPFPLRFTEQYVDTDRPSICDDSRNVGHEKVDDKDHEKIDEPSATGEAHHNNGRILVHDKERCLPVVLNKKNRRLHALKSILKSDDEDRSYERSSSLNEKRCKLASSTNEIRRQDQTVTKSCVPQQLNVHSHLANKRSLPEKKVRFLEDKPTVVRSGARGRLQSRNKTRSSESRTKKRVASSLQYMSASGEGFCKSSYMMDRKGMVLQGLEFLLTGYSSQKKKELEVLIRKYGGYVLSSIPSFTLDLRGKRRAEFASLKLPIVLSPKKVKTTIFLYGCAISSWIVNANWLLDSVQVGSILPPGKYMTWPIHSSDRILKIAELPCFGNHSIFDRVGVMLHGNAGFCIKYSKIIKHGGGQIFKSLQKLIQNLKSEKKTVGFILVENEGSISRHLKHCALEHDLQTMPVSWIVNSLFSGKLLPFKKEPCVRLHRVRMPAFVPAQMMDMSEEI